jgi:hypothetical protein
MGNLELPKPIWPDEGEGDDVFVPTPDGVLDGLPKTDPGGSLYLLMGPKDIATIDGLPATNPDHLTLGHPDGNYLLVSGPKNPIGPVQAYPETGKDSWRAGNDDAIVAAGPLLGPL